MVRTIECKAVEMTQTNKLYYFEFAGLSTDDKPTENVANGSVFIETNTGKVFMFSEPSTWTEVQ